jgi:rubrerythrin
MNETQANDMDNWKHHLQDEIDAAYLYRHLAAAEKDEARRDIYSRLAIVEDKHVRQWQNLLREAGEKISPAGAPSARAKMMGWLGKHAR